MLSKFMSLVAAMEPQGKLLKVQPLTGGVSAQTTALKVQNSEGEVLDLVVRCHGRRDLERNPNIAGDEFRLLQYLHTAGLPVPRPHFLDQAGVFLSSPCLVCTYIAGSTKIAPSDLSGYLTQMANTLACIHQVSIAELIFLPHREKCITALAANPTWPQHEGQAILQSAWPWPQKNRPTLLHGDFWPGNILWQDNQLAGVIDWEDAALGDPLTDLASTRLELLWAFGAEAMHDFTTLYYQINPIDSTYLAYYDLVTALQVAPKIEHWGLEETVLLEMRAKLHSFAAAATAALRA